jgi:predicted AlkP superfamily phosphohydrolase/phosphomutase
MFTGLVSGSIIGLFISFQILIMNGRFGLNYDSVVLSLYTGLSSLLIFALFASLIYFLLLLFERIFSKQLRKRKLIILLSLILPAVFVFISARQWAVWGGGDFAIYSIYAVLFSITIFGSIYMLMELLRRSSRNPGRSMFIMIFLLAVFSFTYHQYKMMWETAFDPDLSLSFEHKSDRKLIVIGLDSANWYVMDQLLEQGLLPTFEKVMKEGAYGSLESIKPTASPIIWSSIITGKHYRQHGISGFAYYNIPGLKTSLQAKGTILEKFLIPLRRKKIVTFTSFTARARKCDTFWNIMSQYGHSIGVVNWMGSWPVEEVNGFMVSNRLISIKASQDADPSPTMLFPFSDYDDVVEVLQMPAHESLPSFLKELDKNDLLLNNFYKDLEHLEREVEVTISLAKKYNPDILLFYDHYLDSIQHRFWRFMEPDKYKQKIPDEHVEKYGMIIPYTYMYLDHLVQRLIAESGSQRDVVIVSDHGMEPIPFQYKSGKKAEARGSAKVSASLISAHHNKAPPGIIIMKGKGIKEGGKVSEASIYDVTPTLLYLFDFPVASDMEGRILEEAFEKSYVTVNVPTFITSFETEPPSKYSQLTSTESDAEILEKFKALGYIK